MDRTISPGTLALVADELERARAGVDSLAALISGFVSACPPAERSALLAEVQAVDILDQHLQALAGFVRDLSAGRTLSSAAGAVPLADLAAHLADGRPGAVRTTAALSGDFELFD